jgi:fatty-acyl-CoA synthase
MIVSGGENVFPREIDELLVSHDGIDEAAVVGIPDPDFGARLRAYVVRTAGSSLDEDGVKSFVKENLARYKVPREVVFIDEMPRNPAGKVVKRELPRFQEDSEKGKQAKEQTGND